MNRLQANICLICVTLCWSTEVIIFSCIPADVSPFATTFICNTIAALILTVCILLVLGEAFKDLIFIKNRQKNTETFCSHCDFICDGSGRYCACR